MTKNQLLVLMGTLDRVATRFNENGREVWRVKNQDGNNVACSIAIKLLRESGFIWCHYPTGSASAGLNETGKFAYKQLVARFPKYLEE